MKIYLAMLLFWNTTGCNPGSSRRATLTFSLARQGNAIETQKLRASLHCQGQDGRTVKHRLYMLRHTARFRVEEDAR